jgi:hypothetical protein
MRGIQPPGIAEEYFHQHGGSRLLATSGLGLLALVAGSFVAGTADPAAFALHVVGSVACAYVALEAWARVCEAPLTGGEREAVEAAGETAIAADTPPPRRPGVLRSVLPFGFIQPGGRLTPTSFANEQTALLVRVTLGSALFAALGGLLVLLDLFRLA